MHPRLLLSLALVACSSGQRGAVVATEGATLAITNVRVFDGERVVPRATVLVGGATILAAGPDVRVPAGTEVVDGAGRTLLPGLIDAHAHVFEAGQLEDSLAFGVTTVLDMFSLPAVVFPLRDQPTPGRADLRSAGTLATAPGGHGTEYGFEIPTITTPGDAQKFADARFAEGSDYLKIVFDGGAAYGRKIPTVDAATLNALIAAAHARSKLAVVHIGTYDEAKAAFDGGADGIVHLFRDRAPDPTFGTLVAQKRGFVTPTLTVLRTLQGAGSQIGSDAALGPYLSAAAKTNLAATFPIRATAAPGAAERAIALLRDASVPILVGTDAPNPGTTFGATMHEELELLVAAGVPATTALAGATALAAGRFALPDRGRIAPGQRADLVLVEGDPTTRITDTRKIVAVWHAGAKFDRAAYQARATKPIAKPDAGIVSDFEDGSLTPRFGQEWTVSTDALVNGTSTAKLEVLKAPRKALSITGTVVAHQPASWAGAMYSPGPAPFSPIDLTGRRLRFAAKGDGKTYVVMVFAQSRGRAPVVKPFTPGKDFTEHAFAWAELDGIDGKDVTAILIGAVDPGPFAFVLDDVRLD